MNKLLGFVPDADPTTPGVLTSVTNLVPYENGMKGAPTGTTPNGVPALAAACQGAVVVTKRDETRRIIAGTQTKLYELLAGAWSDVSTGSYTGGTDSRWSVAQFGDSTLASNLNDTIQRSTGSTFSAVSGAPKAKIIFSTGSQIMALNINDGTAKTDGWYCCATYDETNWTTSTTTLCAKGQLVATQGPITAGGRLGEYAIAYKQNSIYLGQFVGAPIVWDWTPVPGDAGCIGMDAWCDIGGAHFIVGNDNLWLFSGSTPTPIGGGVRQWFFDNSSPTSRGKTQCVFDKQNNTVWVFYPSRNAATLDSALVYHLGSKQWGHATLSIESALNYVTAGVTIDDLDDYSATIDGLTGVSFDSQFWLSGGRALAVFNTSHQLQTLTGVSATSSMTTGDVGDDDVFTFLSKVRLRFAPGGKPTSATLQTFHKHEEGDSLTVGYTVTMQDGKFDVLQSARFHRGAFNFVGDHKVTGISVALMPEGDA